MNITRTQSRFSATWVTEFLIERGSVPDRPVPHSRTGAAYQVQRATMEFTARASHADPGALKLENGSGFLRTARDGLRTHSVTLAGARLKKDGTPGQQVVSERLWGLEDPPEWLRELIARTREQLS